MPALLSKPDMLSDVAATLGVNTLGGWTRQVVQNPLELPPGSTSSAILVQTSDEAPCTFQIDTAATTFAATFNYHRISAWLRHTRASSNLATNNPPYVKMTCNTVAGTFLPGEPVDETLAGAPTGAFGRFVRLAASGVTVYVMCTSATYSTNGAGGVASGTTFTGVGTVLRGRRSGATMNLTAYTAPAFSTLWDIKGDAGFAYRSRGRLRYTPASETAPDHSCLNAALGGLCMFMDSPSGLYGADLGFNHTECGTFHNAAGTGVSGGVFLPSIPTNEWWRFDFMMDLISKRCLWGANGFPMGFYSFADTAAPTTSWLFTLPDWPGFRHQLCGLWSWRETANPLLDSGIPAVANTRGARTWSFPPTFAQGPLNTFGLQRLSLGTPVNGTDTIKPMSLVSGNRPMKNLVLREATGVNGTFPFGLSNLPIAWGDAGYGHLLTRLRFGNPVASANGISWTGFIGFQGYASLVFDFDGANYRLKDYSGTVIATWAKNEQVLLDIEFKAGRCWVVVSNQSIDFAPAGVPRQTIFSGPVTLHPSDVAPSSSDTYVSLSGQFIAATSGDLMTMEAIEHDREPYFLIVDSYVEAAMTGTVAFTNSDVPTGSRSCINRPSLMQIADSQADVNATGRMFYPAGRQCEPWCFVAALGLSGHKITDWWTANEAGLTYAFGWHLFDWAGDTNNYSTATTLALSDSISDAVAAVRVAIARHFLDRGGSFTWLEQPFAPFMPDLAFPGDPMNKAYANDCWHKTNTKSRAGLDALRLSHASGLRCRVLTVPDINFGSSIHPDAEGTAPAFISASQQLRAMRDNGSASADSIAGSRIGRLIR